MRATEKNSILKMVLSNYFNNIKKYDELEKQTTAETVISILGSKEGILYYITDKLDYSETIIDFFFLEKEKRIAVYVITKKIEYFDNLEGFISKKITFIKQDVPTRN
jgi:hypothetical protein